MKTGNRCLRYLVIAVILSLSMIALQPDISFAKGEAPSIEEASLALSKIDSRLKVLSVNPTTMSEFWEVVIELKNRKKAVVYMNPEKNLIFAGNLYDFNAQVDLTKVRQDDLNRLDFASISREGDLVLGNPAAKKKVIVFDDPD